MEVIIITVIIKYTGWLDCPLKKKKKKKKEFCSICCELKLLFRTLVVHIVSVLLLSQYEAERKSIKSIRSKHIKNSRERCLLGQNTTCEFKG